MPHHYNPLTIVKKNRRNNGEPKTLNKINAELGITKNNTRTINPLKGKSRRSTRRSKRKNT